MHNQFGQMQMQMQENGLGAWGAGFWLHWLTLNRPAVARCNLKRITNDGKMAIATGPRLYMRQVQVGQQPIDCQVNERSMQLLPSTISFLCHEACSMPGSILLGLGWAAVPHELKQAASQAACVSATVLLSMACWKKTQAEMNAQNAAATDGSRLQPLPQLLLEQG